MEKGKDYTEEEEDKLEAQKEKKKKNIRKKLKDFLIRGYSSLGLVSTEETQYRGSSAKLFTGLSLTPLTQYLLPGPLYFNTFLESFWPIQSFHRCYVLKEYPGPYLFFFL